MAANTHSLDLERSSSQYAQIVDGSQTGLDFTGDFTFEAWVNIESAPSGGASYAIINKNDTTSNQRGYQFLYLDDGGTPTIRAGLSADGTTSNRCGRDWSVDLGTATWVHLALTCDVSNSNATKFVLYVNGVSQGNGDDWGFDAGTVGAIYNNTAPFQIGEEVTNSKLFDGLIDEVAVYNTIVSSAILALNTEDKTGRSNLQGYWKLNNDYADSSGNSNTLTASGSPAFSTTVPFASYAGSGGGNPMFFSSGGVTIG